MALRDFFVDRTEHPETSLERGIRAQLRLSSNWRVVGMKVVSDQKRDLDVPRCVTLSERHWEAGIFAAG